MATNHYHVFCDMFRNDKLLIKDFLVTPEPYEIEDDEVFVPEEMYMYALDCLLHQYERREAEEMLEEVSCDGYPDSTDGYVNFEFIEPNYGTIIREFYCNFYYVCDEEGGEE